MRPVLYTFRRCPYAMRARLAILSSGIEVELREILLRDKPQAFLAASPSATVPTLLPPDGPVIDESLDIMMWALTHNDPEGWLEPPGAARQDALALIADNDGPFKMHLDRYKYHTRYADCDRNAERLQGARLLHGLDRRLGGGMGLCGDLPGLADMAILPFIRQFANADRTWFDAQAWPNLLRWLQAFEVSDRFSAIMTKYPPWSEGDAVTLFGR